MTDVNAFASKNASDEEKTGEIAEKLGKVRIYEKKEAKGKLHSSEESRENFDKLISGGRSLGDYDNKDISHVISYAYANAHKEIPLSNESVRDLGAMAKLKDKLARDPRGLLAISKGWGITATTEPRLDLNLQVKAAGIKIELISNIKESFILATDKKIGDFAQSQLGEKADPEAVSALTTKLKDAISRPEANSEYFGNVCREVDKALRKAGIKKPSSEDNLHFIRQVLELKAGETRFNASTNEFSAKAFQAFGKAENAAQVEKIRKSLLEKAVTEEDKKAVNEAADDRIRALPVEAIAKSFGSAYETPKISEPGAIAIETKANKGEITADGIRKDLARNIESHKALSGAATALQSAGLLNGKHISELSAHEITKTAKELKEKPNPSEAEKKTIGEMEKYEGTVLEAKRETVAIVRGISYDEVRQLEKRGETVESMYEKARAEPIFKTADKISVGEIPDRISYENFSSERMERMRTGQTVSMDLGSETTNVIIAKTGDSVAPYRISVGGMEAYSCNEKNLVSHLEMAKLLCENGLEFLAPVSADMLRIASVREGNLATAKDGEFTDREKRALLKTFADTFEIEGFPKGAVETRQMETYLKTYATERGASLQELGIRSKILDESGNIANKEGFLRRLG
ncbi:MAG: hypothetical protein QG650_624 [Patescibacteria group bacterium]|nr:hypothetical protein [Patescibacteria group bacterium]